MSIGGLLALLVLVICVVLAFLGFDLKVAGLIGALALAILLSPYKLGAGLP